MDTSEDRRNQLKEKLLNTILSDPDLDFEPIAENLIQKGILTKIESDKILDGWKRAHGYDRLLVNIWNMPGLEHLKGPQSKPPSSQTNFVKSDNPDYRALLRYYVEEYKELDFEKIGKEYVTKGILPQIAVDNILHRWRKRNKNKQTPTGLISRIEFWWKSEIKNTSFFFQGLGIAIVFCVGSCILFFNAGLFPEMSDTTKIFLLGLPIGYAAQYYLNKHLLLKDIVKKIYEIRCRDERYATTKTKSYEDAVDEITAQNIKLTELQFELEDASKSNSIDRIIAVYVIYILVIVIWRVV